LELAGGIYGLYASALFLNRMTHGDGPTYAVALSGAAFFLLSITAGGLLLASKLSGSTLSLVVQAVQVLVLVISGFVWSISSGPKVVFGVSGLSLRFLFDLGSYFEVGMDESVRGIVGVNLLALFWLIYLVHLRDSWLMQSGKLAPPEE
jgi:hypothetical protein